MKFDDAFSHNNGHPEIVLLFDFPFAFYSIDLARARLKFV